jgi:hypothetical protein
MLILAGFCACDNLATQVVATCLQSKLKMLILAGFCDNLATQAAATCLKSKLKNTDFVWLLC